MHQVDILQYTHKFDNALAVLKPITAKRIKDSKPYLITATIYQAKEDYNASLDACKKLIFRSSHLVSATCLSISQSYVGKLAPSYELLKDIYAKAKKEDLTEKSWALTSLADMAYRLGKKEVSLVYLKEALSFNKNDYFVLKKMSELYLEQKKYEEVKLLLKAYEHVDSLLLRVTVVKEKLNEDVMLAKENLQAFVTALRIREEKPHEEDMPYFKMLGIK
jgi:tetratricopeptide (TPR) repeat protein